MKFKKYIISLILVLLIFAPLNIEAETNEVSVWAGEENLVVFRYAAEKYNEKYGENSIVLDETTIGAPDVYQKITTGLQAGGKGLADVMLVGENVIGDYITNFSEHLMNVSEYGFEDHQDQIATTKIETLRNEDGDIYGIPFDIGPTGIFYRKDIFDEMGIDLGDIKTWDDYITVAEQVINETDYKMLAFNFFSEDEFYRALMNQQDSFYFDSNGEIALDSPESKRTLELMKSLEPFALNISSYSDGVQAIVGEKVITMPAGVWYTGTLRTQAPEMAELWSAIPFPAFEEEGNRSVNLGGSSFLLLKDAKNPELTYDFMSFFATDPDVQSYALSQSGIFPSFTGIDPVEVMKDDDYFDDETWSVFVDQLDHFNTPNYREYAVASDIVLNMVGNVMNGQDIDEAVSQAADQLNNMLP